MKKWLICSMICFTLALFGCAKKETNREVAPYQVAVLDGQDLVTLSLDGTPKVVERLKATDMSLTLTRQFPTVSAKGKQYAVAQLGKGSLLPVALSDTLFLEPVSLGKHSLNNTYAVSDQGFLFTNSQRGGKVTFYQYSHQGKELASESFNEAYDYVDSVKLTYADGRYYALMRLAHFDGKADVRGDFQLWIFTETLKREAVIALEGKGYLDMLKTPDQLYLIEILPPAEEFGDKAITTRLLAYDVETQIASALYLEHDYPYALHFDHQANQLLIEHDRYRTAEHLPVWTIWDQTTQEQQILPLFGEGSSYSPHLAIGFGEFYTLYGNHLYRYRYDDASLTDIPLETLGINNPSAIFVKK